jgi:hypothetical protein
MSSAEMLCSNHNDATNIDKFNIYYSMFFELFLKKYFWTSIQ